VELGPAHARRPHAELDATIDSTWDKRVSANPRVYDAPKYRLAGALPLRADDHGTARPVACALKLGITGYKEYLGTHTAAHLGRLMDDGRVAHGDENAHLSCALGVETVLMTRDAHVVMLRRSMAVATHGGLYNGPSGHPEPAHAEGGLNSTPAAALAEVFGSVTAETIEETGVRAEELSEPLLIGCMVDGRLKPDLLFVSETPLSADEVVARFRAGAPDAWESSGLVAVPPDGSGGWDCAALGLELTAVTQAAMECMRVRAELIAASVPAG